MAAPVTRTVTKRDAPSPSAAMARASRVHTCSRASANARKAAPLRGNAGRPGAAAPLANRKHESLVDVSESTVTLLNVRATTAESAACASGADTGASVVSTAIIVAMSGMIMPDPFAMPPTVNVHPA